MKVQIAVLVLVCNYCITIAQASGAVENVLDEDLAVVLKIEKNDQKVEIEDNAEDEVEILPRSEKSLLGTFPLSEHTSAYNPRATQPLTSSTGLNRQHFQHDRRHQANHDGHNENQKKATGNLIMKFPFEKVEPFVKDLHQSHKDSDQQNHNNNFQIGGIIPVEKATIDQLEVLEVGDDGRKCVNKVMMREETEYDEILTCDHSYDNRCHTSYVTRYEPHQEEECEEKFRKVCTIDYEQKANQEVVEVCTSSFIPDCNIEGEEVCQTVWTSECSTVQIVHEVEDDIANCETIEEEKCEDVMDGFQTQRKCDTWPREKCTLDKQKVKKYTPQTSCKKVPQKACSPRGCGVKEGPVNCQDKVKTIISENPVEECDMEPLRTCKHVTKLVPKLDTVQDCVDVPKEICARSKVNPRKVKKPSIQKWCFTPQ